MHNKLLRNERWYPSSSNTRWFLMIDICHLTSPPLASISKNIFHNLHKYISQFVQRYFKICTNTEWFLMITFLSWPPHHLVNLDQSRINWKSIPEISNRSKKVQLTHTAALNFQIQSEYLLKLFVFPLNDFVVIFVEKWGSVWIERQKPIYMSFESQSGSAGIDIEKFHIPWNETSWFIHKIILGAGGKFHRSEIYMWIHPSPHISRPSLVPRFLRHELEKRISTNTKTKTSISFKFHSKVQNRQSGWHFRGLGWSWASFQIFTNGLPRLASWI